jgi:Zn-dependent M28 family amino/carboxypeptidase
MGMGNGYIWNGADDNGSGTVGVMTIAKAIMETGKKPDKTIVVALWTAEEEGLLGSRYFVQSQDYPVKDIKLNMNFDMISRYISPGDPKKVTMTYTGSFPSFQDLTTGNIKKYGIDLVVDYQPSADPPGGTDHRSFVAAGIPIIRFKPGHREEYHTPKDELSTVNWDIMKEIIRINFADVWELANTSW